MRCPRQWEFRYIKGLKIPPNGVMVAGSAYHAALKATFDNKISKGELLPERSVLDAFDTYWNSNTQGSFRDNDEEEEFEKAQIDWGDTTPGQLKDVSYFLLKKYHKEVAPTIQPTEAEKEVVKGIAPSVDFMGIVDLQTEDTIIDHKLKSRAINYDEAQKDSQPFSYCFLTGKKKFIFHAAIKKRLPEIQFVEVSKTTENVEWWVKGVQDIVKQMQSGVYPPKWDGWWCGEKWCGYYSLCQRMR
jgi:putative RecB family exonuclease